MMKKLAIFTVLIALLIVCKAAVIQSSDFDRQTEPQFFNIYTNVITIAPTNTANFTNQFYAGRSVYHTFQFTWLCPGTNSCTNFLDGSQDGVNWTPEYTNSFQVGTNSSFFQFTGQMMNWRERTTIQLSNGFVVTLGTNNVIYGGH